MIFQLTASLPLLKEGEEIEGAPVAWCPSNPGSSSYEKFGIGPDCVRYHCRMNAISIVSSILGMLLGSAGLAISILNYLRDRSKVRVTLQWNIVHTHTKQVQGLVRVTNVGRRVVYFGIAALEIPGGNAYI